MFILRDSRKEIIFEQKKIVCISKKFSYLVTFPKGAGSEKESSKKKKLLSEVETGGRKRSTISGIWSGKTGASAATTATQGKLPRFSSFS